MAWSPYPLSSINEEEALLLSKGMIRACDSCNGEGYQSNRQGEEERLCPQCRGAAYLRWRDD